MTRLRTQPKSPPPAVVTEHRGELALRRLTTWLHITDLGLSDSTMATMVDRWSIAAATHSERLELLLLQLDQCGVGERARAHLAHLEDARARWAG